jgi:hypothetical protein
VYVRVHTKQESLVSQVIESESTLAG